MFYVLTTAQTYDAYRDTFLSITQATDQQLDPAEVVCDFEAALISAVQVYFPNAITIGCLSTLSQQSGNVLESLHSLDM